MAFPMQAGHIAQYTGGKHSLVGYVAAELDVRMDGVRYIVAVTHIGDEKVHGRVYVKSELYPRYVYGDVLQITCRVEVPEPIEDFRYDMYLARFRVFALCQTPRITKVGEGDGQSLYRFIFSLKIMVAEKINVLWHEPYASFMAGLLYGYRGGLGSLNELFAITGVTHIIAISGYNITIVASILIAFCTGIRIPRKKAFWIIIFGIMLFVLFAGASASVVRAGIMGGIVLFAKQLGRNSRVGNVMMLTAVIMCLHNPFVLLWDAGFQLSFVATMGLVYGTKPLERVFFWVPKAMGIQESLVSTLAAIIATLPLILYQFGRLSLVAPVVNILILWVLPWIMLFGFFAVCVSAVFLPLAQVLSWIAFVGMKYIVVIVSWFAQLPFASIHIAIPAWSMCVAYMYMIYLLNRNKTQRNI
jgi:competence protein ComEC